MADFRKGILVLSVLVLLFGMVSTVSAQPQSLAFSCTANAGVNTVIRNEGLTELLGDVVLNCRGGQPTPAATYIPQVNITLSVPTGTTVTSRLMSGSTTESMLLIDEPWAANPNNPTVDGRFVVPYQPCDVGVSTTGCKNIGDGNGGFNATGVRVYYGGVNDTVARTVPGTTNTTTAANKNIFNAIRFNDQTLLWPAIPVDPPGSIFTRVIRITNVRINATQLVAGSGLTPIAVGVTLNATPPSALPITNPGNIAVAGVQKGLKFTVSNTGNWQQCFGYSTATQFATLKFTEQFSSAFKKRWASEGTTGAFSDYVDINTSPPVINPPTQNVPGAVYWSESGLMFGTSLGTTTFPASFVYAGIADQGTRLKAVFTNIPTGVKVYVDSSYTIADTTVPTNVSFAARLVASESGAFATLGTAGSKVLIADNSTGTQSTATAVWEVLQANPFVGETASFGAYLTYTANPAAGIPAINVTSVVQGSFAPIRTEGTSQTVAVPIPRFGLLGDSFNLFTIYPCVTNLLFPFVTNQVGFDTGLAISNTTWDPWGTSVQQGSCRVYTFGSNPLTNGAMTGATGTPVAGVVNGGYYDTPPVVPGTTYVTLASVQFPNFQGYVIAVCKFQYAHGFAFVATGLGNPTGAAMGYLALIIPDAPLPLNPRLPAPFPDYWVNGGEQLGY